MNQFRSLVRSKPAGQVRIQDQHQDHHQQSMQEQVRTLDRNFSRTHSNGYDAHTVGNNTTASTVPNMYGTFARRHDKHQHQYQPPVTTLSQVQGSDPNLYAVTEL
ncbi:uncharacterized protein LOC131672498 [Phymastichus coffea]|uniref:uncharacterized protein LOC131672498 n=1 Tax=Phymastichus coffea TaxID=108790 RepID=UPI00273B9BA8|nr:uncharacterized protein LOC131672498 [Phymastichus coffea]